MSLLIVGLDSTIVNIALPAIHRSFHGSLSGLQWTIDAYTLVLASLLMLSGWTVSAGAGYFRSAWSCSRSDHCCAPLRRRSSCW